MTIRITCRLCGDVEIRTTDAEVVKHGDRFFIVFECPSCHRQVNRPSQPESVAICRSAGVAMAAWDVTRHGQPPMTEDEIDAMVEALTQPGAIEELDR